MRWYYNLGGEKMLKFIFILGGIIGLTIGLFLFILGFSDYFSTIIAKKTSYFLKGKKI